ncbi:class A sortase [Bacillus sp. NPDC077411]|uniref:class A sortase n=1 Tax=Bacillus sp. NPDC077411 TaxID=3363947 RepID=UPI0037C8B3C4
MKNKFLYVLIGLIFVTGIGLIVYQPLFNYYVIPKQLEKSYEENYNKVTTNEIKENVYNSSKKVNAFDYDSVQSVDEFDFNSVKGKLDKNMIIGLIYIPNVHIKLPILYGTNYETMMLGAGTLKPNMTMGVGNYVLGSHSMRNKELLFTPTRNMGKGDLIYLTDKEYVYTYKTTSKDVISPKETHVMNDKNGLNEVTLISCYDSKGETRLVVKGRLESKKKLEEVDGKVKSQLTSY